MFIKFQKVILFFKRNAKALTLLVLFFIGALIKLKLGENLPDIVSEQEMNQMFFDQLALEERVNSLKKEWDALLNSTPKSNFLMWNLLEQEYSRKINKEFDDFHWMQAEKYPHLLQSKTNIKK